MGKCNPLSSNPFSHFLLCVFFFQANLGFELERMEWYIQDMDGGRGGRVKGVGDKGEKGEKEYGYLWRKHTEKQGLKN